MNWEFHKTLILTFVLAAATLLAADAPPVAPLRPVTDDYHGAQAADGVHVRGRGPCACCARGDSVATTIHLQLPPI
jgi:hypothetical protein